MILVDIQSIRIFTGFEDNMQVLSCYGLNIINLDAHIGVNNPDSKAIYNVSISNVSALEKNDEYIGFN